MVLLPLAFSEDYSTTSEYKNLFNENTWYEIFSRSIYISLVLTSFLPYVFGVGMGWFIKKVYKRPPPATTKKIKIERKYALFLLMAFVVFTFGSHMPFLFLVAALSCFV
jgi:hypothetical protein